MKKNIVVVGTGYWGKNLVRNFSKLNSLYSICDLNLELAKKMAFEYGTKCQSWKEVLEDTHVDAIVIATPAPSHYNMSIDALKAGKNIFVEKPLALTTKEAIDVMNVANQVNRVVMVGHLMQYHAGFNLLQNLIREGVIGDIHQLHSRRLSLGKIRTEENVLWSFAPHDISMILSLLSQSNPISVNAVGSSLMTPGIEDFVSLNIRFPNEIFSTVTVSWLNPIKEQKFTVVGSKGMIVFDDLQSPDKKVSIFRHKYEIKNRTPHVIKNEPEYMPYIMLEEPLLNECKHFLDCLNNKHTPKTDAIEAIKVLEVLERAQLSLNNNFVGV